MKAIDRTARVFYYCYLTVQAYVTNWIQARLKKRIKSIPLSQDHTYIQTTENLKWQLLQNSYHFQFNEAACSVASVAIVLNAASQIHFPAHNHRPISQIELLKRVNWLEWQQRVEKNGYQGRRGLPIDKLGLAVAKSFKAYAVPYTELEVVACSYNNSGLPQIKQNLMQRLEEFATDPNCFIIAHFNQGSYIKSLHIPHISPVAAYDQNRKRVLVMDVDQDQKEAYWVDHDVFFKGLAYNYSWFIKKAGYTGGGYIWLRL